MSRARELRCMRTGALLTASAVVLLALVTACATAAPLPPVPARVVPIPPGIDTAEYAPVWVAKVCLPPMPTWLHGLTVDGRAFPDSLPAMAFDCQGKLRAFRAFVRGKVGG